MELSLHALAKLIKFIEQFRADLQTSVALDLCNTFKYIFSVAKELRQFKVVILLHTASA
jgi:hypothetical protein